MALLVKFFPQEEQQVAYNLEFLTSIDGASYMPPLCSLNKMIARFLEKEFQQPIRNI